jgi:hypothetical protein
MSNARRLPLALIAALMLSACGAANKEADSAEETPTVDDTAFGDMVGTIDKAKGVQDTVDSHKAETDRRLDEGEEAH